MRAAADDYDVDDDQHCFDSKTRIKCKTLELNVMHSEIKIIFHVEVSVAARQQHQQQRLPPVRGTCRKQ